MKLSVKSDYAVRAVLAMARRPAGEITRVETLAAEGGLPPNYLVQILIELKASGLVRSVRGKEGGYQLARPADQISVADVLRCIDGPLASVRDIGLGDLPYSGPTAALTDVWRALRASMRSVLEETTLADVSSGALPDHVDRMARDYLSQEDRRGRRVVR